VVGSQATGKAHGVVKMKTKYIVKMIVEGDFPGSPDMDTREISEAEYNQIWNEFFRGRHDETKRV